MAFVVVEHPQSPITQIHSATRMRQTLHPLTDPPLSPPREEPAARGRFTLIDGLRGLAATSVMLYHYGTGDMKRPLSRILPWWVILGFVKGWLGVQVFFVLSGFVIAFSIGEREMTPRAAALFAARRQVRLDPPYWASIALSTAMPWLWQRAMHDHRWIPTPGIILAHVLYAQQILRLRPIEPVYWTLAVEVQFYMVFVLGLCVLRKLPKEALSWALVLSGLWALEQSMHWRVRNAWFVPNWYLFALGAATWWTLKGRLHGLAYGVMVAWIYHSGLTYHRLEPRAGVIVALLIFAAGRLGRLERWLDVPGLQWLGKVSYGIYLLHPAIGAQVRWRMGAYVNPLTPYGALTVTLTAMATTVYAASLLHFVIERPAMRLASKIRWAAASGGAGVGGLGELSALRGGGGEQRADAREQRAEGGGRAGVHGDAAGAASERLRDAKGAAIELVVDHQARDV